MFILKSFEKKSNYYIKICVITLNIYIFNAFGVKILTTNSTFGDKVHKYKYIYIIRLNDKD